MKERILTLKYIILRKKYSDLSFPFHISCSDLRYGSQSPHASQMITSDYREGQSAKTPGQLFRYLPLASILHEPLRSFPEESAVQIASQKECLAHSFTREETHTISSGGRDLTSGDGAEATGM